jgi:hypothetical protein
MTRVKVITSDGAHISTENPLPVSFGTGTLNVENVNVSLTAATDSVAVEPGVADIKISLDGELVTLDNTADIKVTLDGELVTLDNTADIKVTLDDEPIDAVFSYEGGTAVGENPPHGVPAMFIKGGYIVPINDLGNDLPVTLGGETVSTVNTPAVIGPITIALGASLSDEIDLGGATCMMIEMPDAFTGTTLTFQASRTSGGTFKDVKDSAKSEVQVTVEPNEMCTVDKLAPARYIKIRSGTSAIPTAEEAERILYVITK